VRQDITVHKLDEHGEEVWRYPGAVLHQSETQITLEARFDGADAEFYELSLRRGDRFVETFYSDRYYNIFEIHDVRDNRLKGWYCNITRPARIEQDHVFAQDLALDLIVFPNGRWKVVDEDEFQALDLDQETRRRALEALHTLQDLASTRSGPFQARTSP
jgi:predicted RNA-binding protein associated with RNAse of E/G family